MKKAVGYMRVSTDRQGDNGISLEVQEHTLNTYAEHAGYRFLRIERDVQTGKGKDGHQKRSGLRRALDTAKEHGCPLIVSRIDRLTRDTETMVSIANAEKVEVLACVEGSLDAVSIVAAAAKAQREGELISRRTREALAVRKKQGVQLGNSTNLPEAQARGHAANSRRAFQQAKRIAPLIAELEQDGVSSLRKIADALNAQGVLTDLGRKWNQNSIRSVKKRIAEMAAEENERANSSAAWGSW